MKKTLTTLTFALTVVISIGQTKSPADSLRKMLPYQKAEAARMQIKIQIGDYFEKIQPDSALHWYKLAIPDNLTDSTSTLTWFNNASDPEKYLLSLALARFNVLSLKTKSDLKAINNIKLALQLSTSINQPQIVVYCSDNLALYYANTKDFKSAISFFEKSLEFYHALNNAGGINYCLSNLGALNAQEGNNSRAADYFTEQLNFTEQNQQPAELLQAHMNIAVLYQRSDDNADSKIHWIEALKLSEQLNYKNYSIILSGLGSTSFKTGDYGKAIEAYSKLLNYANQNGDDKNKLTALNNLAMISTEMEDNSKAMEFWNSTLTLAEQYGKTPIVLDALLNLSNINLNIGNYENSAAYFDRYIAAVKQQSSPQELAEAYIKSGRLNDKSRRFDKSKENYLEALKIYEGINDTAGIANANLAVAKSFTQQGLYTQALEFVNAVTLQQTSLPANITASAEQILGDIYRLQLQFPTAINHYQKAFEQWQQQNDFTKIIECLNTLGNIYEITGNLPLSIKYYQLALDIANKNAETESMAAILNNIGVIYRQLGDNSKAKDSYLKALDINIKKGNAERISYGYNNLGILYEQDEKLDSAVIYFEKSLAIKESSQDQKGLAASLINLGNAYKRLNKLTEAEEKFNKSLSISQSINDKQGEAFAYGSLAALKLEMNDLNASIDFANKNLEIAKTIDLKKTLKEAYRQLAWAYENTNQLNLAEEDYKQIIDINQNEINANFSILSENEKEMFFKTVTDDYDRFYAFAQKRQDSNPAINDDTYNTVLRNKGLLLKSSTAMRNAILSSNNNEIIGKYEQWTALKQSIAQQYSLPASKRANQLKSMEDATNNLERELVKSSAEFNDYQNAGTLTWIDIKSKLLDNEAAIEFINFKTSKDSSYYAALIISKQLEHPIFQILFEEKKLEQILGALGGNNLRFVQNVYGTMAESNTSLYNLIWKPIEKYLKGYTTVYYSPSGLLHKISFSAIAQSNNHYLVDDYNLHLVSTTANAGGSVENKPISMSQVTLFGGITYSIQPSSNQTWKYLQGTLTETEMIGDLFTQQNINVTRLTDTSAREEDFKLLAPRSSILHIATHGFFYPDPDKLKKIINAEKEVGKIQFRGGADTTMRSSNVFIQSSNPLMRSGLVFARANDFWGKSDQTNGDDGVLTALEVLNIDLRQNQLVVMSACETGLGDIAGSEGVYGLQRSFRMAGSQKLIMSLWQVPDAETAEFMKIFYTNLIKTANLRESFIQAQKQMRQKYDPYFWAAFVLLQ